MQEKVKSALRGIIHPETQQNIVDSGGGEQVMRVRIKSPWCSASQRAAIRLL